MSVVDIKTKYLPDLPQSSQPPAINYPPVQEGLLRKSGLPPTRNLTFDVNNLSM